MDEIITQFTAAHGLEFIAQGFDNAVYADAVHTTAFRFPKKADRVETLRQEAVVLPTLTPDICGATILAPTIKTEAGLVYGIYPFVTGKLYADCTTAEQTDLLAKTATFLQKLHQVKNPVIRALPIIRSYDRFQAVYEGFAKLTDILTPAQLAYGQNLFTSFLSHHEYQSIKPVLVHADISLDHLYYQDGQISVIDWSDFHLADPAYDWHHLLNELPKSAHQIFFNNYDVGQDESFWERAYAYRFMDTFEVLLDAVKKNDEQRAQDFVGYVAADMAEKS